jgi:phasin
MDLVAHAGVGPDGDKRAGRPIMNEDGRDRFEIPKDMRSMTEAGFEQARKAFEKFIGSAQAAADSLSARSATVGSGAKDINAIAFSYAEKNVQAALDYAQSLLHAKDFSDVMRLQREYMQTQVRALAEQASEMGQIMSRTAMGATKPKM